jgi:hypothetical protein
VHTFLEKKNIGHIFRKFLERKLSGIFVERKFGMKGVYDLSYMERGEKFYVVIMVLWYYGIMVLWYCG